MSGSNSNGSETQEQVVTKQQLEVGEDAAAATTRSSDINSKNEN